MRARACLRVHVHVRPPCVLEAEQAHLFLKTLLLRDLFSSRRIKKAGGEDKLGTRLCVRVCVCVCVWP